jgi:hypothetical protein
MICSGSRPFRSSALPATICCLSLWAMCSAALAQDVPVPARAPVIVSATANGAQSAEIAPGWPLIVDVFVLHRETIRERLVPFALSGPGGSWIGAVQLSVRRVAGDEGVAWTFQTVEEASGTLLLDEGVHGEASWVLAPEVTAQIPPGTYEIHVTLGAEAFVQEGSFRAERAPPIRITVEGSGALTPEQAARGALLMAEYEVRLGNHTQALSHVEALLVQQPEHITGLAFRGALIAADGKLLAALDAYDRALALFYELHPDPQEPPLGLLLPSNLLTMQFETAVAFEVTVEPKGTYHPHLGQSTPEGFSIDGISGGELLLERGVTYSFRMKDVPAGYPFYLTTSPSGVGTEPLTAGVEGAPATGNDEVLFTPGPDTPDVLYYQSTTAPLMGWRIRITDAMPGVSNEPEAPGAVPQAFELSAPYPNPTKVSARFSLSVGTDQHVRIEVVNLLGRRVMTLHDGPLSAASPQEFRIELDGLASGVYFVRAHGERFAAYRRIVVVR